MEEKFNKDTLMKLNQLLDNFLENAPSDEEIEETTDADADDIIEIYAEAKNLKQAIENAGF